MFTRDVLLRFSEEAADVVVDPSALGLVRRRPNPADVSDEALCSVDAGFAEHAVEFLAGGADEGLSGALFLLAGRLAYNHDVGGTGAARTDHMAPRCLLLSEGGQGSIRVVQLG